MKKDSTYKHSTGGGYVSVAEVTDTHVTFFPIGGGFHMTMPIERFLKEYTAAEVPTDLTCGPVILDGMDAPVTGWYGENRWNGWLIAYVSLEDCLKILEVYRSELIAVDDGYRVNHPEWGEMFLTRCDKEGLSNFYYIDGYCWEPGDADE